MYIHLSTQRPDDDLLFCHKLTGVVGTGLILSALCVRQPNKNAAEFFHLQRAKT
jgi:hypothetical protein